MSHLLLVRHGESRWNLLNRFTGWVDVPLSEQGINEALLMAKNIAHLRLDMAFTSMLERAHETLLIMLSHQHCTGIFSHQGEKKGSRYHFQAGENEIPIYPTWVLNERHYGALQGMNKHQAAEKFGQTNVLQWRRGYKARPPQGESLKDVYGRVIPFFRRTIVPQLQKGKNILVVAHGNTLRCIIKYLEHIDEEQIAHLEMAPAHPFIYTLKAGELVKEKDGYSFERPILWK